VHLTYVVELWAPGLDNPRAWLALTGPIPDRERAIERMMAVAISAPTVFGPWGGQRLRTRQRP